MLAFWAYCARVRMQCNGYRWCWRFHCCTPVIWGPAPAPPCSRWGCSDAWPQTGCAGCGNLYPHLRAQKDTQAYRDFKITLKKRDLLSYIFQYFHQLLFLLLGFFFFFTNENPILQAASQDSIWSVVNKHTYIRYNCCVHLFFDKQVKKLSTEW